MYQREEIEQGPESETELDIGLELSYFHEPKCLKTSNYSCGF